MDWQGRVPREVWSPGVLESPLGNSGLQITLALSNCDNHQIAHLRLNVGVLSLHRTFGCPPGLASLLS